MEHKVIKINFRISYFWKIISQKPKCKKWTSTQKVILTKFLNTTYLDRTNDAYISMNQNVRTINLFEFYRQESFFVLACLHKMGHIVIESVFSIMHICIQKTMDHISIE